MAAPAKVVVEQNQAVQGQTAEKSQVPILTPEEQAKKREQFQAFCETLKKQPFKENHLNLSQYPLTDEDYKTLATLLKNNMTIRSLDLSGHTATIEGVLSFVASLPTVSKLKATNAGLKGPTSAPSQGQRLALIDEIDLSGNPDLDKNLGLPGFLRYVPNATKVKVENSGRLNPYTDKHLDLSSYALTGEDYEILAKSLKGNNCAESLDVSTHKITAEQLFSLLACLPGAKKVKAANCDLSRPKDLPNNFSASKQVLSIDLSGNPKLLPEGTTFVWVLGYFPNATTVNLANCDLKDPRHSMEFSSKFEYLDLSNNPSLTNVGIFVLIRSAKTTIKEVNVANTALTAPTKQAPWPKDINIDHVVGLEIGDGSQADQLAELFKAMEKVSVSDADTLQVSVPGSTLQFKIHKGKATEKAALLQQQPQMQAASAAAASKY